MGFLNIVSPESTPNGQGFAFFAWWVGFLTNLWVPAPSVNTLSYWKCVVILFHFHIGGPWERHHSGDHNPLHWGSSKGWPGGIDERGSPIGGGQSPVHPGETGTAHPGKGLSDPLQSKKCQQQTRGVAEWTRAQTIPQNPQSWKSTEKKIEVGHVIYNPGFFNTSSQRNKT